MMEAYERIARVIRHLEAHHTEQPDLAVLAGCAGLSPYHFHRLFTAWAGVTPKDFLQCLTVAHAGALLRSGASVLEAALAAGLSGAGRLHDLCVTLEAATPGEVRRGGAGMAIAYGRAASPFGPCFIAATERGICRLAFLDGEDALGRERAALRQAWRHAEVQRDDDQAAALAQRVFQRRAAPPGCARLRAYVQGTAFQVKVWRALLAIPCGQPITYGAVAAAVGRPRAARAVGSAVASNAIAYLIPCHRVIRETGIVGAYRWGTTRKRAMLAWESAGQRVPGT